MGYRPFYSRSKDELEVLYRSYINTGEKLYIGNSLSPNEIVNRLAAYMKLYNPEGYSHVYRTYSVVGIFRQSIFYALLLFALAVSLRSFWEAAALSVILLISLGSVRFSIETSVAAEYDFIIATAKWIGDKKRIGEGSATESLAVRAHNAVVAPDANRASRGHRR